MRKKGSNVQTTMDYNCHLLILIRLRDETYTVSRHILGSYRYTPQSNSALDSLHYSKKEGDVSGATLAVSTYQVYYNLEGTTVTKQRSNNTNLLPCVMNIMTKPQTVLTFSAGDLFSVLLEAISCAVSYKIISIGEDVKKLIYVSVNKLHCIPGRTPAISAIDKNVNIWPDLPCCTLKCPGVQQGILCI